MDFSKELTSWVNEHTAELLSWALHRTSDKQAAEDLVQETFLAAAEQFASFNRASQPRTWLFAILNNKIAGYFRSKSRHESVRLEDNDDTAAFFTDKQQWRRDAVPLPWNGMDDHLFNDTDFIEVFERCLGDLPPQWHTCLTSKYIGDRPAGDICQELGISTTNYWQVLHRAKLRMRKCLEEHWFAKK